MKPRAYYNENDPYAAAWLENLIAAGHIMDGEVDTRSIVDVEPGDLDGFTRCHFFAGIAGWDLALSMAGWPEDEPVWTGSCPCQPFSSAGKRKGTDDARHLWPEFHRLIAARRPPAVCGEQVAGAAGVAWLSAVRDDLAALDYAVAAVDIPACSVGAPHIRQRLYWVGVSAGARREGCAKRGKRAEEEQSMPEPRGADGGLGHARGKGLQGRNREDLPGAGRRGEGGVPGRAGTALRRLADHDGAGCGGGEEREQQPPQGQQAQRRDDPDRRRVVNPWADLAWVECSDGRARPVPAAESGVQSLAHGVPGRVGRLRAYGNAIVPPLAADFVAAVREAI